jgi:Holliday junction resolvasome RuvABC endonuclease subunit
VICAAHRGCLSKSGLHFTAVVGISAACYGGFLGQLSAWCEQHAIPYQGVPVGTIKRHATGKGNANKDAMLDAVRGWGYAPIDDNEADAIALLHWAIAQEAR